MYLHTVELYSKQPPGKKQEGRSTYKTNRNQSSNENLRKYQIVRSLCLLVCFNFISCSSSEIIYSYHTFSDVFKHCENRLYSVWSNAFRNFNINQRNRPFYSRQKLASVSYFASLNTKNLQFFELLDWRGGFSICRKYHFKMQAWTIYG